MKLGLASRSGKRDASENGPHDQLVIVPWDSAEYVFVQCLKTGLQAAKRVGLAF